MSIINTGLASSYKGGFLCTQQSVDAYLQQMQREQDAKVLCGGLLGDGYLLMDVIYGLMTDLMPVMREQKWFRQKAKKGFSEALKTIRVHLAEASRNSVSDTDVMVDVADAFGEKLRMDFWKMRNGMSIELGRLGARDAQTASGILLIDTLIAYVRYLYDSTLNYCCTIYGTYDFYDSWYSLGSCRKEAYWWNMGVAEYAKTEIPDTVDLNTMQSVRDGLRIIDLKIHDQNVCDSIRSEVTGLDAAEGSDVESYKAATDRLFKGAHTDRESVLGGMSEHMRQKVESAIEANIRKRNREQLHEDIHACSEYIRARIWPEIVRTYGDNPTEDQIHEWSSQYIDSISQQSL